MIIDFTKVKIFVHPGITDMRKAVNGLSIIVTDDMNLDPCDKAIFLFCNRNKKLIKALYWDRNGFCLWQKRLEKDHFPWPSSKEEATELSLKEFEMLLDGIDFFKAHKPIFFYEIN